MGAGDEEFQKLAGQLAWHMQLQTNYLNKVLGEYRCLRLPFNLYTHVHARAHATTQVCLDSHMRHTHKIASWLLTTSVSCSFFVEHTYQLGPAFSQ